MDSLLRYFERVSQGLQDLIEDIERYLLKIEAEEEASKKKSTELPNVMQGKLQPVVRLRADDKEIEFAKENPYEQAVIDRVNDIFLVQVDESRFGISHTALHCAVAR